MSIVRKKHRNKPYVILDKRGLEDEGLSWKAKGILAYLISKPDDWQVYLKQLSTASTDGIDATRSGMKELVDAGYVRRQESKKENGKFAGHEYVVYEHPSLAEQDGGRPPNAARRTDEAPEGGAPASRQNTASPPPEPEPKEPEPQDVDPATGWSYDEMTFKQKEEAKKGWPLGRGISDPWDHPGVKLHEELYPKLTNDYQRRLIAKTLTDAVSEEEERGKSRSEAGEFVMSCWDEALEYWKGDGHRAQSVKTKLTKMKEELQEARAEEAIQRAPGRSSKQNFQQKQRSGWGRAVC